MLLGMLDVELEILNRLEKEEEDQQQEKGAPGEGVKAGDVVLPVRR